MRLNGGPGRTHTRKAPTAKGQQMLSKYRSWMMTIALLAGVLGCDESTAESPDNSQAGAAGQAGTGGSTGSGGTGGSGANGGGGSSGGSGGSTGGQGGSGAVSGMGGGGLDGGPQIDGGSGEGGAGGLDASDIDAGPSDSPTFTSLYDDVFGQEFLGAGAGCANAYCHGATGSGGFSVSTRQGAYASLVNAEGSANCGGEVRVVPGDPDASLLVQKITDPSCGERMPKDNEALSPETVERIRAWISAGAMNN